jgi:exodeoxyribonuclease V alpha subunit
MEQICGYIDDILFINPENGFTVAKLKESQKKEVTTICGIIPNIQPGETILCDGMWKNHPQYGRQFAVENFQTKTPSDTVGILKYLESGLVKGIGPVYAKRIVDKFLENTLIIIDEMPHRLHEVVGIGKKRIASIIECFKQQKTIRDIIIFLRSHNISPSYAQKIFKKYGNSSIETIKQNPYQMAKDIDGIGFKTADNIAEKIGITKNSPLRISAGIEYTLFELASSGHTCFPLKDFLVIAEKILQTEPALIQQALDNLILQKQIIKQTINNQEFIWLKLFNFFELEIAKDINRILTSFCSLKTINGEKAVAWVENLLKIKLAENQKEAVLNSFLEKIHIITGGPGTGKSTITNAILKITEKLTDKIILAAPTGRAAKRLSQITKKRALTIHALLEFDFTNGGFKKNASNPLKCDLIIIDEASMIDITLMYHLIKAIPSYAKVVFVGDINQLPSVGPGNILKDLIASNKIKTTVLNKIFRQAAGSKIIINAHRINNGEFPYIKTTDKDDFHFLQIEEPEQILKAILSIIENQKKFYSTNDIQVISPMKRGLIGTEHLNMVLQNFLNPSDNSFYRAGRCYRLHDKVMQTKNNYQKNVFNGDIGTIYKIDVLNQQMHISFDDRLVEYNFIDLDEIVLAYAVSVHKYQGSECPCVIIPMHISHFKLLTRNLLYTAVTRGKKQVYLISTMKTTAIAINNKEAHMRFTALKEALLSIPSQMTLF